MRKSVSRSPLDSPAAAAPAASARNRLARVCAHGRAGAAGDVERYNEQCLPADRVIAVRPGGTEGRPAKRKLEDQKEEGEEEASIAAEAATEDAGMYLVKWFGLTYDACTWEAAADIAPEPIEKFRAREAAVASRML